MRLLQPLRIARLTALPPGFEELAADAMADRQKMLDVLQQDWTNGAVRFDGPGEGLFGAYAGEALLGLCGLTRDPYLQGDRAGRVRRLYVRRVARRHGAGRALLRAVMADAAAAGWPRLRVRAPATAFAFYEGCGFLRVVGEPSATHALPLVNAIRETP